MNLTQEPEIVTWPETQYVFLEKIGPFENTAPQAWQNLHQLISGISEPSKITGYLSLYKVQPKIYRAGCIEHYVNDPRTTPEEQLVTEILIPTI
jgi:hypothetical protein